ncbi:MAG: IS1595 family transposase [Bryobacteraceae bacterium]|jgi:transposase-like protein
MENAAIIQPHFTDPDKAREYLEAQRWPDGPVCPHCGVIGEAFKLEPKPNSKTPVRKGVWKCSGCRKQFTVTVGTIFEDSHIPLNKWLFAIHLLCASKKGMSSLQLQRMLGVTYKSMWFMTHRIRAMFSVEPQTQPKNTVEVDETYVGGFEPDKRGVPKESKKTPVLGMVERGGDVRSFTLDRVTVKNVKPLLVEHIQADSQLNTDDATIYYYMKPEFPLHASVNHSKEEYSRKENGRRVSTNTIEGYFSIIKRGVYGTYHHWSKHQLFRYLHEFDFRYNTRYLKDTDRAIAALKGAEGKRLYYYGSSKVHNRRSLVQR